MSAFTHWIISSVPYSLILIQELSVVSYSDRTVSLQALWAQTHRELSLLKQIETVLLSTSQFNSQFSQTEQLGLPPATLRTDIADWQVSGRKRRDSSPAILTGHAALITVLDLMTLRAGPLPWIWTVHYVLASFGRHGIWALLTCISRLVLLFVVVCRFLILKTLKLTRIMHPSMFFIPHAHTRLLKCANAQLK